jgi:transketolase
LKAAEGKDWTVVNASSLNPADTSCIRRLAETHAWIITAEDHYSVGGLGSAVAEVLAETATSAKLHRIGVETFGESGEPDEIYKHYGFDSESLRTRIQKIANA